MVMELTTAKKIHPKVQKRIVASLRFQLAFETGPGRQTIEAWRKKRDDSVAMGVVVPADLLSI